MENWAEMEGDRELNGWVIETLEEVCRYVKEADKQRGSVVQHIVANGTDFSTRIITPWRGQRGVT